MSVPRHWSWKGEG